MERQGDTRLSEELPSVFTKIRNRAAKEGLVNLLYSVSGQIDYPHNGFPRYGVDEFMKNISAEVGAGALVLDAGAGPQPYKRLFDHARYQSCDYLPVLEETGGNIEVVHTFYCDLESIPQADDTYDAIICNQVLEHVRKPEIVVSEFFRILKPGGKLFLTAPQCAGIHMEPFHYFNYTKYGLRLLFEKAGFVITDISPLGGIFWLHGKVIQQVYNVILSRLRRFWKPIFFPIHVLIRLCLFIICLFLFHLDKMDTVKGWTLNYGCCCVKPSIKNDDKIQ